MFGVLIVQTEDGSIGYLTAFSGILAGKNIHPYFVPPVYDLLQPQGFFKIEEENISAINRRIRRLEEDKKYIDLRSNLTQNHPICTRCIVNCQNTIEGSKKIKENCSEKQVSLMQRKKQS